MLKGAGMRLRLIWVVMVLLLCLAAGVQAQDSALAGMSADEIAMLNDINRSRLRENLVHLSPNARLNELARFYIGDLTARPINALGEIFITRDGRNLDTLLAEVGYPAYPGGRVADFIPMIIRDFGPRDIIDYWFRNYISQDLRSRRMIRENEALLPVFSPLYREIGIAASFNQTTQRYYYVIIFAAQPNVLPVIITEPTSLNVIARRADNRDVILYVHDERVVRFGGEGFIGGIEWLRISTSNAVLPCSNDSQSGWRPYENEIPWQLADVPGPQTLYVQMCDGAGRTVMMSTQVFYREDPTITPQPTDIPESGGGIDALPTPDVLDIAQATQTAAASATFYAPYAATVEAILTATAEALTPTPAAP